MRAVTRTSFTASKFDQLHNRKNYNRKKEKFVTKCLSWLLCRLYNHEQVTDGDIVLGLNRHVRHPSVAGAGHCRFHLHGAQHDEGRPGLDVLARLDGHVDDLAGHGGPDAALVAGVGLLLCHAQLVAGGLLRNFDHAGQPVQLEEDLPAPVRLPVSDRLEHDLRLHALAHVQDNLLIRLHRPQKGLGGQDREVRVLLPHLVEIVKDSRVQRPGYHVQVAHGLLSVLVCDLPFLDRKVHLAHLRARPPRYRRLPLEHLSAQLLREPARRLAQVPLEVLDHARRKIQLVSLLQNRLLGQVVLNDELGEVADDLAAWSHLDNVAQHLVAQPVGVLDSLPLIHEAVLHGLELEVGVLASWHLVLVHLRVARLHAALKLSVLRPDLLPVGR
mmetsp:Transcript_15750/g.40095  ORF Transcript_15750/g.40095 Transcript_15750/m.40095 type:complete len:386 (-) Transcript_15750:263-1420(-)